MSKNNLAARIAAREQWAFNAGWGIGFQQAMDFVSMALNGPDVMGKSVMSGERLNKILGHAQQLQNEYYLAFKPKEPEADVWQERLDAAQKRIYKSRFQPFYERYPDIREVKY